MKEVDLIGRVSDDLSSIQIDNWRGLTRIMGAFRGKELHIKLKVFRKNRSLAQNRYIHGVVVPSIMAWYLETQGEKLTHDEVYTWLRTGLLDDKVEVREILGEQVVTIVGKRFSKMNTKEFTDAIETIIAKMAELDCYIQLPKENNMLSDYARD